MTKAKKNNKKVLKKIESSKKDSHKKSAKKDIIKNSIDTKKEIKNNKTKNAKDHFKKSDKNIKENLKDLKNSKKIYLKQEPKDNLINSKDSDYKNKKQNSKPINKKQSVKSNNIIENKNISKKDKKQKLKKINHNKANDKKPKLSTDKQEKLSKNIDIKASFHRFNNKDLQSKNIENGKKEADIDENKKNEIVKKEPKNNQFSVGDKLIYPAHGVGVLTQIEVINIQNTEVSCYLLYFEKEKLSIRIPVVGSEKSGLRALVSKAKMDEVLGILRSGVKKMKGMWSRRAQEYETKINSGDIIMLAEVLRDLTRDIDDTERSYSERIIYETAIYRLATEYSAIYKVTFEEARDKIILIARDKIESDIKDRKKINEFDDFDFDDFEKNKNLLKNKDLEDDEDEDSYEDEDEEEEDGDFEADDEDYETFDDEDDDFNDKDD
ncbi:MAG: hypothetical protein LW595_03525 [Rickettsiales bacterium]|nr:hypothetical protein [Rickettsiales bacterium]